MITIRQVSNIHPSDHAITESGSTKINHTNNTNLTFTSHSKSESIKSKCLLVFFDSNKANYHTLLTLLIQVNNDQFLIILPSLE